MSDAKSMIKEFQCPGCVCGCDPDDCSAYDPKSVDGAAWCDGHVCGTTMMPGGTIALGLPKGFCKTGVEIDHYDRTGKKKRGRNKIDIRLWADAAPKWDRLNVPVWALEQDGYLFVRTFMPRINSSYVEVIKGGTMALVPQAINVAEFIEEID